MTETGRVTFTIPGPPVSKQRPRRAPAGHFYTPQKTVEYELAVAGYAMAAGVKLQAKTRYALGVDLYLSTFRRDRDNIVKCIQDGLQRLGDGWDDSQVCDLVVRTVSVRSAAEEKAVVTIEKRAP